MLPSVLKHWHLGHGVTAMPLNKSGRVALSLAMGQVAEAIQRHQVLVD